MIEPPPLPQRRTLFILGGQVDRGRGQGSRAEKHLPLGSLRDSFRMSVVLLKRNESRALLLSLSLSPTQMRLTRVSLISYLHQGKWWCSVPDILVSHFPCRFASLGNFSFSNGFGLWFGSRKQEQFSSTADYFSGELLVCGLLEIIILYGSVLSSPVVLSDYLRCYYSEISSYGVAACSLLCSLTWVSLLFNPEFSRYSTTSAAYFAVFVSALQ